MDLLQITNNSNNDIFSIHQNGDVEIKGNLIMNNRDLFKTIEALKNLLIFKKILTEEEINNYIDSLKVMDKLIGE